MKFKNYLHTEDYDSNHFLDINEKVNPLTTVPKKTVKAYKLFIRKGGSLFPLFVNAKDKIPIGKWIEADVGSLLASGKVKSKIGALAFRPGWHSGNMPIATHIGGKSNNKLKAPDYRPDNQVWAEVLVPADVNWQAEAEKRAKRTKAGKILARTAQITDQIPKGGHYTYKTNPNMTGAWLISGAMKVIKILTDDQVKKINKKFGVADLPRLKDLEVEDKKDQTVGIFS